MINNEGKATIGDFDIIKEFAVKFARMGDDYIVARLDMTPGDERRHHVDGLRPGGMIIGILLKGTATVSINTDLHHIKSPSIVLSGGNNIINFLEADTKKLDYYLLYLSESFLSGLNIDMNAIQQAHLKHRHLPVIDLNRGDASLVAHHMDMLCETALLNPADSLYSRSISRSLVAALVYQLMQIADRQFTGITTHNDSIDIDDQTTATGRRTNYVTDFLKLLHANFKTQRAVQFYADQLCISPKYLAAILRRYTNRTPGEWIDEYVILEAKNMLRFSGMSIQEVAYALNFSSQSNFGKYFKSITGMSPTQFQKN